MNKRLKKEDKPALGRKLEILRLIKGQAQDVLADALFMSKAAYSRIESCSLSPKREQLEKILAHHNLSVVDFEKWDISETVVILSGRDRHENSLQRQLESQLKISEVIESHNRTLTAITYTVKNENEKLKLDLERVTKKHDLLFETIQSISQKRYKKEDELEKLKLELGKMTLERDIALSKLAKYE